MIKHTNDRGKVFVLIETEPYINKAGVHIELDVWASTCEHEGCANTFTVKTPTISRLVGVFNTNAFYSLHCAEHKLTRSEAIKRRFGK